MKYSPEFEAYSTVKLYFLRIIFIGMLIPFFYHNLGNIRVISHYKCVSSIYICYLAFPAGNTGNQVWEGMKQWQGELRNAVDDGGT